MGWVRVDANIRLIYGGGSSSGHDDQGEMCLETVERGRGAKVEVGRLLIFCNARMPPGLYPSRSRPRGLGFNRCAYTRQLEQGPRKSPEELILHS